MDTYDQLARSRLIAAERCFRKGQCRKAAAEAGQALKLIPDLETNLATSAAFESLRSKVEKAFERKAKDLKFWAKDERLDDDWGPRARDLLFRNDRLASDDPSASLADSVLLLAEARALLREVAAQAGAFWEIATEDNKYHEVASFTWGQPVGNSCYSPVKALAFGPGNLLAAYTGDGRLHVWHTTKKRKVWALQTLPDKNYPGSLSFSPEGDLFAFANPFLRLWHPGTGKNVKWLNDSSYYELVAFSHEGLLLTVKNVCFVPSDKRRPSCLWDTRVRRPACRLPDTARIRSAAFGPIQGTAQPLALGTYDGLIHIWNLTWTLEGDDPSRALRFVGAKHARMLRAGRRQVMSVAFSVDGRWLAAVEQINQVRVWAVATGQPIKPLVVHDGRDPTSGRRKAVGCTSVAFSPTDPHHLAVACSDGAVRVWNVLTGNQVARLEQQGAVTIVAFQTDGTLASTTENGWIYLWRRGLPTR